MYSNLVYKKAMATVNKCGTRNPLKIARQIGIEIRYNDSYGKLLGWYYCRHRHRFIFLNGRMDEELINMVVAHELGHDMLHRDIAKSKALQEFVLFRGQNHTEYEANAFAAHILLDDDTVNEFARCGYNVVQMAQASSVDVNLMLIKLEEMRNMGHDLRVPTETDGKFWRKVRI